MIPQVRSLADVYKLAEFLRDTGKALDADQVHKPLDEYYSNFWTTSFEALGELRLTLLRVQSHVTNAFPAEVGVRLLDALHLLDEALGNNHRPS